MSIRCNTCGWSSYVPDKETGKLVPNPKGAHHPECKEIGKLSADFVAEAVAERERARALDEARKLVEEVG